MKRMKKLAPVLLMAGALAVTAAGCGGDESKSASEEVVTGQLNQADTEFVEHMVPHHQDAVDQAEQLLEEGSNPTLRRLAEDIIAAQQEEIDLMNEVVGGAGSSGEEESGESHEGNH